MPALCLHIGQCGNQIGYEIWDRLQYEAKKSKLSASGVTRDPASAPLYSDELGFFMREDARGDGLHQAIGFYRTTYIFAPRCWNVVFAQAAGCYRARAILVDTEPKVRSESSEKREFGDSKA